MIVEKDIKYEAENYWVLDEKDAYTVYKVGLTHSTSDSSYQHDPDGLSVAIARCNYLAGTRACKKCGAVLKAYWIGKDRLCNGCRNPQLIVTAIVDKTK